MLIAGFNKTSFVDYPGKLCAVVFTPACSFDCWYCHNRHLLKNTGNLRLVSEAEVFAHLEKRKDVLEGVVITGGEPTLQRDLARFVKEVKEMGLAVKLDTNGTHPEVVEALLEKGLLDYVAMDIKAPLCKLPSIVRVPFDQAAYRKTINLLLEGRVDYEFRTTFVPTLTVEDITLLAMEITGAKRYFLQQYRPVEAPGIVCAQHSHPPETVQAAARAARAVLGTCEVRGL